MFDIPILFVVFNRKDTALKSFQSIRNIKPTKLYIACDGPRKDRKNERQVVEDVRKSIMAAIDWPCETKTFFQSTNLGCSRGVYTAINWLFENEEKGIILEDDCVASPTFFPFVEEMLSRYENDTRIGMIAGYMNFGQPNYPYSYWFSRFKSCWGWATWRRAWKQMDLEMCWRDSVYGTSIIANSGYHNKDKDKWDFELKCIDKDVVSAWDWQWYFSLSAQNQLCIYPEANQISNIGDDKNATHTSFSHIVRPSKSLKFPLVHPPYICPYEPFDKDFFKNDHTIKAIMSRVLPTSLKSTLKKIIKH